MAPDLHRAALIGIEILSDRGVLALASIDGYRPVAGDGNGRTEISISGDAAIAIKRLAGRLGLPVETVCLYAIQLGLKQLGATNAKGGA